MRTRVVWTLSASAFDGSMDSLAERLDALGVSAILSVFDDSRQDAYANLRRALETRSCHTAMLFSLIGRRSFFLCDGNGLSLAPRDELHLQAIVDAPACLARRIPVGAKSPCVVLSAQNMLDGLNPGSRVLFGYGEAEVELLSVERTGPTEAILHARVVQGDSLRSGLDVNSTSLPRGLFPLLPVDEAALKQGLPGVADGVIAHGIQSPDEVRALRDMLGNRDALAIEKGADSGRALPPLLLYRVDSATSLELVPSILDWVDGVHLNRSELGTTIHLNDLPLVQKDLISRCNRLGKTILVSSDLLASMRKNPNPTRAEVSDLANLVLDGVDAVIIGREVTEGKFASAAAEFLQEIWKNSEEASTQDWGDVDFPHGAEIDAMARAALHAAEHVRAKAIVCLTRTGYTAGRLSSLQAPVDVIAASSSARVLRQVSIMRSVRTLLVPESTPPEQIFREIKDRLRQEFGLEPGERIVVVSLSASPVAARDSNLFVIEEI